MGLSAGRGPDAIWRRELLQPSGAGRAADREAFRGKVPDRHSYELCQGDDEWSAASGGRRRGFMRCSSFGDLAEVRTAYRTVRVADTATMAAAISTEFGHHQFTKHRSALLKNAAVEASFFTEFDRVLKILLAQISGCSDDK
jgi:hypothetical protein